MIAHDSVCAVCNGPLEYWRDAICERCHEEDRYFNDLRILERAIEIERDGAER